MLTVPIIKSAIKRVSVNNRQREENRGAKSKLATEIKKFRALVEANKIEEAEKMLPEVVSVIDSSAKKGIITRDNASRKVSRLSSLLAKAKEQK
jgi:small subunit ribosomal protein S20